MRGLRKFLIAGAICTVCLPQSEKAIDTLKLNNYQHQNIIDSEDLPQQRFIRPDFGINLSGKHLIYYKIEMKNENGNLIYTEEFGERPDESIRLRESEKLRN